MKRCRASFAVGAVIAVLLLTAAGNVVASSPSASNSAKNLLAGSPRVQVSGGSGNPTLVATCQSNNSEYYGSYDPADGYLYFSSGESLIYIVSPLCHVVKTITTRAGSSDFGVAYDPLTKEILVTDEGEGLAFVLQGTKLVKTVNLGKDAYFPSFEAWDGAIDAMLVAGDYGGGVDLVYLTLVDGATRAKVVLNDFDTENSPSAVLVADGYIFSAGDTVNVFNERTLAYIGTFPIIGSTENSLAWDPLNNTVVLGEQTDGVSTSRSVLFLNANSIQSGRFTFEYLTTHNILYGGAADVAYSPADHDVYITAAGGVDVWALTSSGSLYHVYLENYGGVNGLVYDPSIHEMYVCGDFLYVVS
jgi:DNA-binding beta-propeller fold protein YncE